MRRKERKTHNIFCAYVSREKDHKFSPDSFSAFPPHVCFIKKRKERERNRQRKNEDSQENVYNNFIIRMAAYFSIQLYVQGVFSENKEMKSAVLCNTREFI